MPILLKDIHHTYAPGTPWARPVLRGVNLEVPPGECLGILGRIGSGKSTLVQHLNGLLLPQRGEVRVGKRVLRPGEKLPRLLYREVGILFQFPEKQLFADTVFEDVAGGPRFAGCSKMEEQARVTAALERVGLDPAVYGGRAPYTLTWGEKRMAALAGVLALDPPRLVFDEPGAGLDPAGRVALLSLIRDLVRREGKTVLFVSHHLDDLFRVADRLVVLSEGRAVFQGSLSELCRGGELEKWGLTWPSLIRTMQMVAEHCPEVRTDVRTPKEAAAALTSVTRALFSPGAPSGQ